MLIKRSNIIDVRDNGGRGIMRILDHQGRILWEKGSTPPHPEPQFDDHDPLTIVKTDEGEGTVMFSLNNTNKHVMYRTDKNGDWKDVTGSTTIIKLNKGEYVQFASDDTLTLTTSSSYQSNISTLNGTYEVYGNVQSLLNNSDNVPNYCFRQFFNACNITKAPALPATSVGQYGYQDMFSSTAITKAPALPATTLATHCYERMFFGCRSLITAPSILPATTLATYCYKSMFSLCDNLETAPELPATYLSSNAYTTMLSESPKLTEIKCYATNLGTNTSSTWLPNDLTGVFYKNPAYAVPSSRNGSTIPSNMTVVDWIK